MNNITEEIEGSQMGEALAADYSLLGYEGDVCRLSDHIAETDQ